ncbi:hypothetical protein ACJX0J_011098 [Zea mays]
MAMEDSLNSWRYLLFVFILHFYELGKDGRYMNVVLGAALSIATEMITVHHFFYLAVTGIIKYIDDVLLLYFEALLLGKQYMLTCPNLGTFYNALCSILLGDTMGHFQELQEAEIHYKQDMIFLPSFHFIVIFL